jgi:excisionase family DNA binding protein
MRHSGAQQQNHLERRAFSIDEIAQSLGTSTAFIRLEIARGHLATLRVGRRVLITRESFDQFLATASERAQNRRAATVG